MCYTENIQKEIESVLNLFGMGNQKKFKEIHRIYQNCFDKLDKNRWWPLTFSNIRMPILWGNTLITCENKCLYFKRWINTNVVEHFLK